MPRPPPRLALSVKIDADTVMKARQLARDFSGKPHYLRLNEMVAASLRHFIEEFERANGEAEGGTETGHDRAIRNSKPNR